MSERDDTPVTGTAPQWAWDAVLSAVRSTISLGVTLGHSDNGELETLKQAEVSFDFEGGKA